MSPTSGFDDAGPTSVLTALELTALSAATDEESFESHVAAVLKRSRTKRRPPIPEYSGIYKLHLDANATLGNSNLREQQQRPWGVGYFEWVAAKTVQLFEQLVFLVTVLEGTCTTETCPVMGCGRQVTYKWADEVNPTPRTMPALEYMETLVEWGHKMLSDPTFLPQDKGTVADASFPKDFIPRIKKLHTRIFRCFAHTYTHHFAQVQERDGEATLNFCFKHWLFFVREFELVADGEMAPLGQLINMFEAKQDLVEKQNGGRQKPLAPKSKDGEILIEPARPGFVPRPVEAFR